MNDVLVFVKRLYLFGVQVKRLGVGLWNGTIRIDENGAVSAPEFQIPGTTL